MKTIISFISGAVICFTISCSENGKNSKVNDQESSVVDISTPQAATIALFDCLKNADAAKFAFLVCPYETYKSLDSSVDSISYNNYVARINNCYAEVIGYKLEEAIDLSKAFNFVDEGRIDPVDDYKKIPMYGIHYTFNANNKIYELEGVLVQTKDGWYIGEGFKMHD